MKRRLIELFLVMLVALPIFSLNCVSTAEAAEKLYVKYDVRIYSKPNMQGKIMKNVGLGSLLTVIKKDGDWINIKTSDGKIGWAHNSWTTTDKSEIIKSLEAKVKPIPASNISGNLRIYKKLLKLDPNNTKYKEKVAYYSSNVELYRSLSEENEKKLKGSSDLELLSWHWSEEYGYVTAEGQVKNISGRKLERVQALVTWYDKNGNMITSDTSLIEYDPILPGQKSPFKVMGRYNPAMKKASIEFKFMWGNAIPTYRK